MKTKIIFLSIAVLITTVVVVAFSYNKKVTECVNILDTAKNISKQAKINAKNNDFKKKIESIRCDGEIFNQYPSFDSIKNREFAQLLSTLPKLDVNNDFLWGDNGLLSDNLSRNMFSKFKKYIDKGAFFLDYNTRFDGNKIIWAPVTLLPSNGKFIMLIVEYWEKDYDEQRSKGYFLCNYNLSGELISAIYAYGHEELEKSSSNNKLLTGIWGRAYCLNTNKPIVRKAMNWDEYDNREGLNGSILEIKEFCYSIDSHGHIKLDKENVIFPKTHVKWKDRAAISFTEESDTIRKMLGEIE